MKDRPFDVRFEIRVAPEGSGWTREAYDAIYNDNGIRQVASFYRWLLRLLDPTPGRRLLDVACGEGVLPNLARSRHRLEAYGVDLSVAGVRIAEGEGAAQFVAGSGEGLPFADGRFDYVTCIGSLEHFLDMDRGVQEMTRVLRPGGTAMILVPNTYSLTNNIYSALKHGRSSVDNQPLQRYLARGEWTMLLEANGLQVEQTAKYERTAPDTLDDALWYLGHWRELVRVTVAPLVPLNLATCFVFLCRRAEGAR